MNRRAKRNKYRKEKAKLENTIKMLTLRNAFCDNAERKDIVTLSIYKEKILLENTKLSAEDIKNYKTYQMCYELAKTFAEHPELMKRTENENGIRFDIQIVKQV